MAIGIKQIDIIRVPKTVPPRPELDIVAVAETARDIACPNDVVDAADDIGEVVQRRAGPPDEDHVVWRVLDMQENANGYVANHHVVDDPKTEVGVEAGRLLASDAVTW